MTEESRRILTLPDHELFARGACHVFADSLAVHFAEENYDLGRIAVSLPPPYDGFDPDYRAKHIVALKDDYIVDISGVHRSSDFKSQMIEKLTKTFGAAPRKFAIIPVDRASLFSCVRTETGCRGQVDEWGLTVDADFLDAARNRAAAAIDICPTMFSVSYQKQANQALEPTSTAVTPPADAGDRASSTRGSS